MVNLFKLWGSIVLCVITNSCQCFSSITDQSNSASIKSHQTLASAPIEIPDITIPDIPSLVLPSGFSIDSKILKFCRFIMYTIPMDSYSMDEERNRRAAIPIIRKTSTIENPLQLLKNRQMLRHYVGGRNVVITQNIGNPFPIMILTGMGPKYNCFERNILNRSTLTNIIDIIDTFPIGNRDILRDKIMDCRQLLELRNILSKEVDEDSIDQIIILTQKSDKIKNFIDSSAAIKSLMQELETNPTVIYPMKTFSEETTRLVSILRGENIQELAKNFIYYLKYVVEKHTAPQKSTALVELEKITHKLEREPGYAEEIIYQVTSLDEGTINSSLTGLKLVDPIEKGHQQALGDLFHSEPLYLLWRTENPKAAPYFFTQRDMCPTCDYHICGNALMDKIPTPIIVLSAKAGNTAGAASVDGTLHLDGALELLPLENSTIFQALTDGIKKLKGKQKTKDIRDQQLSKIERWRLPDLYID